MSYFYELTSFFSESIYVPTLKIKIILKNIINDISIYAFVNEVTKT